MLNTESARPPTSPPAESHPAAASREPQSRISRFRGLILLLPFGAALGAILYFTLVPNRHQDLFDVFPTPIRMWMGMHDNYANVLAFFVFGTLTFRAARLFHGRNGGRIGRMGTTIDGWCLTTLLTGVCVIEIVQLGIPGRDGSFHDVATCWTGLITAWILRRWVP